MEGVNYDSKEGISAALASLAGLHAILDARREAGYGRHERLNQFVVMGRWWLDSCGNCGIAHSDGYSIIPKELFPTIPDVMEETEFWSYLNQHSSKKLRVCWGMAGGTAAIAEPNIPCASCGKTWELADCHDCERHSNSEVFPLTDFVGKTFGEFRASLKERKDAIYIVQLEMEIRNDRFIDLTPKPGYETLKENEHGWVSKKGEITDDYIIQPGDETYLIRFRFYHPTCHAAGLAADVEQEFRDAFVKAGFEPGTFTMTPVPNRYGSQSYRGPWYEVQTLVGTITIGWRKRVVNIDWSATGRDLLRLFDDVDDTKAEFNIHAWKPEQVIDYLTRIRGALGNSEKVLAGAH